ncbi:hypothetical protein V6N13_051939 [Hibiscus sabdariffa]
MADYAKVLHFGPSGELIVAAAGSRLLPCAGIVDIACTYQSLFGFMCLLSAGFSLERLIWESARELDNDRLYRRAGLSGRAFPFVTAAG